MSRLNKLFNNIRLKPLNLLESLISKTSRFNKRRFKISLLGITLLILLAFPVIQDVSSEWNTNSKRVSPESHETSHQLLVIVNEVDPDTKTINFDIELTTRARTSETELELIITGGRTPYYGDGIIFTDNDDGISLADNTTIILPISFPPEKTRVAKSLFPQIKSSHKSRNIEVKLEERVKSLFYPFDKYTLKLNFLLVANIDRDSIIPLTIFYRLDDTRFLSTYPISNTELNFEYSSSPMLQPTKDTLLVFLRRPNHQVVFFIICLSLMLLLTIWSFIQFGISKTTRNNQFEVIGFNLGILLAVPGLRALLVPENLYFSFIHDLVMVIIWAFSSFTLLIFLIYTRKNEP